VKGEPMKILILTAKYGMGHMSASMSIKEDIEKFHTSARVEVIDFYEYSMPFLAKYMYIGFKSILKYAQPLYIKFYESNDREKTNTDINTDIIVRKFASMMAKLVSQENPDLIISTFPVISQGVSYYKEVYGDDIPLITCITDVSSHYEWINPHTDSYLVACEQLKEKLVMRGVARDKIHVYGIPVGGAFKEVRQGNEVILSQKKKANLSDMKDYKKTKELLIIGGGLGILPEEERFYQELDKIGNIHTTLVVGNNLELYDLLHGKFDNIDVLGFTDRVADLMEGADCVMTKPGGITVFEAIYTMTPIISFNTKLPNELRNQDFIVDEDLGIVLHTPADECLDILERFINNTRRLDRIKHSMKTFVDRLENNYFYKEFFELKRGNLSIAENIKNM